MIRIKIEYGSDPSIPVRMTFRSIDLIRFLWVDRKE